MSEPIRLGAVAYSPNVVPIWEGMRDYFRTAGPPIDYVLFSNYDAQVRALLAGHIDVAWNTNLAWAKVKHFTGGACKALAMRDADVGFTTVLAARAGSGIASPADLRGKRVVLGSADSVQAAILPRLWMKQAGIDPERDVTLLRFDLDVGKHGDTGTSELEVLRALREGTADAGFLAASTWEAQRSKGMLDALPAKVVWTSPGYCHCNFTTLAGFPDELAKRWTDSLLAMKFEDPCWRPVMEMEGVRRWLPTDDEILRGYDSLHQAIDALNLAATWVR
jgi:phosphonate transport system substrate-binding protein